MTAPRPSFARILFIGNSYTSRNQLPKLIADLALALEPSVQVVHTSIVAGGASLRRHWNAGLAQRSIAEAQWNYVVLQEQSTLPLKNPQRYHENVRLFADLIAKRGTRAALYLTWSRQGAPGAQQELNAAIETIGAQVEALVVPVGRAWHAALRSCPDILLYTTDGSHPTLAGSYLAACVFVATLFGALPATMTLAERLRIDRDSAQVLHACALATREPVASA